MLSNVCRQCDPEEFVCQRRVRKNRRGGFNGCAGHLCVAMDEGRRKSEIVVRAWRGKKQSLVVLKRFILPPTPHSPVDSVGGWTPLV